MHVGLFESSRAISGQWNGEQRESSGSARKETFVNPTCDVDDDEEQEEDGNFE